MRLLELSFYVHSNKHWPVSSRIATASDSVLSKWFLSKALSFKALLRTISHWKFTTCLYIRVKTSVLFERNLIALIFQVFYWAIHTWGPPILARFCRYLFGQNVTSCDYIKMLIRSKNVSLELMLLRLANMQCS